MRPHFRSSRCSVPARTARACRCSWPTARACRVTAISRFCCTATAVSTSRSRRHSTCRISRGWSWAASWPSPTCVAVGNTARPGIRRARHSINSASLTTSWPLQWLIDQRYTRPERLAIQGGSNGGLLVGAVMTQRPDLFGACLPAVGVMDMLATIASPPAGSGSMNTARRMTPSSSGRVRLFALSQHQAGGPLPRHAHLDSRYRRPCGTDAQLQVCGAAPGGSGRRGPDSDPDRNPGRTRRRNSDQQTHRKHRGPLGLSRQDLGHDAAGAARCGAHPLVLCQL